MDDNERQLLDLAKEFITIQESLLVAWREANPSSRDLEMLLDFPKRCLVRVHSDDWTATRHGLGVRFARNDGLTVDVPYGVDRPQTLDANRLFDFLASAPSRILAPLSQDREAFYVAFDSLCESGHVVLEADAAGRSLFAIRRIEQRSVGDD